MALPQRDFALRDILPLVYASLGKAPTHENLDPAFFAHIYEMIQRGSQIDLTPSGLKEFWNPIVMQLRRMRGLLVETEAEEAKVDAEMDNEGSDWEIGSGVDSEGEDETEQGEGDVAQNEV